MNPKALLASKTVWANILGLVVYLALLVGVVPVLDPQIKQFIEAAIPVFMPLLNIILRKMTSQPIEGIVTTP